MNPASELKKVMLREPRWTLAVAESLTAGHVQARIAAVSGASEYFLGGVTAYSLEQKVALLGVDRKEAKRVNGVSAEIAEAMARGACTLFGADIAVATTGYAEPSPGQGVTAPFAWWAVAMRGNDMGRGLRVGPIRPLAHARGYEEPQAANAKFRIAGGFSLRHGRVECPGAKRVEAQAIVADAAVAELLAFLRDVR